MSIGTALKEFLRLGGARKSLVWGMQQIKITAEIIDAMELSPLSEEIRQVIRESGVPSLQPLLGPDWEEAMRDMQKEYWGV